MVEFLFKWLVGWASILDGLIIVLSFTLINPNFYTMAVVNYSPYCCKKELKKKELEKKEII